VIEVTKGKAYSRKNNNHPSLPDMAGASTLNGARKTVIAACHRWWRLLLGRQVELCPWWECVLGEGGCFPAQCSYVNLLPVVLQQALLNVEHGNRTAAFA